MKASTSKFDARKDRWVAASGSSKWDAESTPDSSRSPLHDHLMNTSQIVSDSYRHLMDKYNIEQEVEGQTSEEEGEAAPSRHLIFRMLIVLFISSLIASATSFLIDTIIQHWVPDLRLRAHAVFGGYLSATFIEIFISVALAWGARMFVVYAPASAGSGIPEVKCMLSGERLKGYLTTKVGVAKALGLGLASSAGLQIGKEGPFVHIATCISARLMTLPMFKDFRRKVTRETLLLAGVSVGVGTTFSAPISGVLFAFEMMMPHMFTKFDFRCCFFGAVVGSLTFKVLQMLLSGGQGLLPLLSSDVNPETAHGLGPELVFIGLCVLLGMICGFLGGTFVQTQILTFHIVKYLRGVGDPHRKYKHLVDKYVPKLPGYIRVPLLARDLLLLAMLVSAISYFKVHRGPMFGLTLPALCNELLLVNSSLEASLLTLLEVIIVKWLLTVVSLCMPVPSGCVAPVLVLGILTGRIFGLLIPESVQLYLAPDGDFNEYQARFAIVGASAFAASVCHAMAMVVTVFELLAIPRIAIPLTFATMTAVKCALMVGPSIFDAIIATKNLPGLPTLTHHGFRNKLVMEAVKLKGASIDAFTIDRYYTKEDLQSLSDRVDDEETQAPKVLPIVEMIEGKRALLGTIMTRRIPDLVQAMGSSASFGLPGLPEGRHLQLPKDSSPLSGAAPQSPCSGDAYTTAVKSNLLCNSMQFEKDTSLESVYIKCHAEHYDRTVMVMDRGILVGILTVSDLFRN